MDNLVDEEYLKDLRRAASDVLTKKLNVMDATAIALCRENHIPIYVFDLFEEGSMLKAICQNQGGSLVSGE